MMAVVFHGIGDIRLDTVKDPEIQDRTDAIVRITSSAIRGTVPGMKPGTVLGHEGVGVVEEVDRGVRNDMGNCNDRTYIPKLLDMVEGGSVDPTAALSQIEPMSDVVAAYKEFDLRRPGWIKVELKPGS